MKTIIYLIFYLFVAVAYTKGVVFPEIPLNHSTPSDRLQYANFFNQFLKDQSSIDGINAQRPKIYFYTDFGGGRNGEQRLTDLQTSGEIASAAWKATLHQELYINDSATPFDPLQAALRLAKTFPYEAPSSLLTDFLPRVQAIVVHVIDPGVGSEKDHPHPRSIVLRKDGVLFIGPDNGTLSFTCPSESIAAIWEINAENLQFFSRVDTHAGGTFHGRDIFAEAAFRIAAGIVSIDQIGWRYEVLELKNRISSPKNDREIISGLKPLLFEVIKTDKFIFNLKKCDKQDLFDQTFLLGVIQSSLYSDDNQAALTNSKKIFIYSTENDDSSEMIAIINHKNGNIFIGPNNGLGTSFFIGFAKKDIETFQVSNELMTEIKKIKNNERIYLLLKQLPHFKGRVQQTQLFDEEKSLVRDEAGRPQMLQARIWIDPYGNIKTTAVSHMLDEARRNNARVRVELNGIQRSVIFADTFSQVSENQLFIYNGSTGAFGPNPHRSKRYVELTANGVFGKFGTDFFEENGRKPYPGQVILFYFEYLNHDTGLGTFPIAG
jgi:S-adenosylmethionine hydrolase